MRKTVRGILLVNIYSEAFSRHEVYSIKVKVILSASYSAPILTKVDSLFDHIRISRRNECGAALHLRRLLFDAKSIKSSDRLPFFSFKSFGGPPSSGGSTASVGNASASENV